jgi:hypothetical protein
MKEVIIFFKSTRFKYKKQKTHKNALEETHVKRPFVGLTSCGCLTDEKHSNIFQ